MIKEYEYKKMRKLKDGSFIDQKGEVWHMNIFDESLIHTKTGKVVFRN